MTLLTSPGANPKTRKSLAADGKLTWILHLSPSKSARTGVNVCPHASAGCIAVCLNLSGRGGIMAAGESSNRIQDARRARTVLFVAEQDAFLSKLRREIRNAIKLAARDGLQASFRLNGTSDLAWEDIGIPQEFPGVQFYDYTKSIERYRAFLAGEFPRNYYLAFSRSETNHDVSTQFVRDGGTATVVFAGEIPATFEGLPVYNADASDYRPADPAGHWLALQFKGRKSRRDHAMSFGFALQP